MTPALSPEPQHRLAADEEPIGWMGQVGYASTKTAAEPESTAFGLFAAEA
jgi:hypothetical protein